MTLAPDAGGPADGSLAGFAARIISGRHKRVIVTMAEGTDRGGRPIAAIALARAIARADLRPVLIDLHNDGVNSVSLGEEGDLPGFSDLFAGNASFAQVIFRDRESRVHFIPGGLRPLAADDLADERTGMLVSALDHTYDHVIFDAADEAIEAVAPQCDAAVIVTEYDETDPRTLRAARMIGDCSNAAILLLLINPADNDAGAGDAERPAQGAAA